MPEGSKSVRDSFRRALRSTAGLSQGDSETLIRAVETGLDAEQPPTLALIGETGVGKSTTINALFNAGQPVGDAVATTKGAVPIDITVGHDVSGSKGIIRIFDMPGIGDDRSTFDSYRRLYLEVLRRVDAILWVHDADDRMVMLIQDVAADLFGRELPHLAPRLVFGLNKVDEVAPRDWNPVANLPSDAQLAISESRRADFAAKLRTHVRGWSGQVIPYSALYRYNLTGLFKALMYAVEPKRRWVLESRMDLADFFELVDRGLLEAATGSVRLPDEATVPEPEKGKMEVGTGSDQASDEFATAGLAQEIAAMPPEKYQRLVADQQAFAKWVTELQRRQHD